MTWSMKSRACQATSIVMVAVAILAGGGVVAAQDSARYVGTNSCAAANCHGGDGSGPSWSSSYSDWVQRDSHARSFSVLLGDRSRAIVKALGYAQPAHKSPACLNCHALPATPDGSAGRHLRLATDGVSCETCHGPASLWITRHVRRDWPSEKAARAKSMGFYDTADLRLRTRICTGCHVGGPGRDVNHDLIAAGHPRLHFEMSTYHANLPRHWDDATDVKRHAGQPSNREGSLRELKLWALGQVETLRARAELSVWRASTAAAPWPELTETRCFSCHHDLRDARWRRSVVARSGRRPGQFPWASWERSMIGTLWAVEATRPGGELSRVLARVDRVTRPVVPERESMRLEAGALARQLDRWSVALNRHRFTVDDLDSVGRQLVSSSPGQPGPTDWDQAAQLYLALSSLRVSQQQATGLSDDHRRSIDRALEQGLPKMRAVLRFPDGHDSAAQLRGPGAGPEQSPVALEQFLEATKRIRSALNDNSGAR